MHAESIIPRMSNNMTTATEHNSIKIKESLNLKNILKNDYGDQHKSVETRENRKLSLFKGSVIEKNKKNLYGFEYSRYRVDTEQNNDINCVY